MDSLDTQRTAHERALLALQEDAPDPAHDLGHIRRVWRMAERIGQAELGHVDWPVLLAATIFHDCVSLPKDAPDAHLSSRLAAEKAVAHLRKTDFPKASLESVSHAIAAHSFSGGIAPETLEAQILSDADKLDALGPIGIARVFSVSGALGRALFDAQDPMAEHRPLDGRTFALDHFETKLFKLPGRMHTAEGKRVAEARAQVMRDFRKALCADL